MVKLPLVVQKLKNWRAANDLSQRQATAVLQANGLPVGLSTVQHWEQGFRKPGPFTVKALETFLAAHPVVTGVPKYGRLQTPDWQVEEIRAFRDQGTTLLTLAERYGISESAVSRICGGSRRAAASKKKSDKLYKSSPATQGSKEGITSTPFSFAAAMGSNDFFVNVTHDLHQLCKPSSVSCRR